MVNAAGSEVVLPKPGLSNRSLHPPASNSVRGRTNTSTDFSLASRQMASTTFRLWMGWIANGALQGQGTLVISYAASEDWDELDEFLEHTGGSFKGIVHPQDYLEVSRSIAKQISESNANLDFVKYRIIKRCHTTNLILKSRSQIQCIYINTIRQHNM